MFENMLLMNWYDEYAIGELMMNLINIDRTHWELTNLTLKYYWTQGELTTSYPYSPLVN